MLGWKPLKKFYINVYIVSIYINVELLSNVNRYSDIKKEQWFHAKKLSFFISLASLIRFRTIQVSNSSQMVHNSYIYININSWHKACTIILIFFLCFFFLFVSSFPLFFLLLHQFLGIAGNSNQHIILLAPRHSKSFFISGILNELSVSS